MKREFAKRANNIFSISRNPQNYKKEKQQSHNSTPFACSFCCRLSSLCPFACLWLSQVALHFHAPIRTYDIIAQQKPSTKVVSLLLVLRCYCCCCCCCSWRTLSWQQSQKEEKQCQKNVRQQKQQQQEGNVAQRGLCRVSLCVCVCVCAARWQHDAKTTIKEQQQEVE